MEDATERYRQAARQLEEEAAVLRPMAQRMSETTLAANQAKSEYEWQKRKYDDARTALEWAAKRLEHDA